MKFWTVIKEEIWSCTCLNNVKAIKDDIDPDPFDVGEPGQNEQDDNELFIENDDEYIESNVCESDILSLQEFQNNLVMPEPGNKVPSPKKGGHTNIQKKGQ